MGIEINWDCNLDYDFLTYCLPKYSFHILDATGWNFRHAMYHEQNRRTLFKAYGLKFIITVTGNAGKFDLTRTIVILVTGLGLMGLINILCDFVLLKVSNRYRDEIVEKKFEQVDVDSSERLKKQLTYKKWKNLEKEGSMGIEKLLSLALLHNTEVTLGQESPSLTDTTNTVENTPAFKRKDSPHPIKSRKLKKLKTDTKPTIV